MRIYGDYIHEGGHDLIGWLHTVLVTVKKYGNSIGFKVNVGKIDPKIRILLFHVLKL